MDRTTAGAVERRAWWKRLMPRKRQGGPPSSILGFVPPPSDDYTGLCPCGCGVRFRDGVQLQGQDLAWSVADEYESCLRRVRAAALSDADLQRPGLQGLRDFLLRETWGAASDLGDPSSEMEAAQPPRRASSEQSSKTGPGEPVAEEGGDG